jgi:titin
LDPLEDRLLPSSFTVVNANDSGPGSLRDAITRVNGDHGKSPDTIAFRMGSGSQIILLQSALPALTHPVTLDGTTQAGFSGAPLIILCGTSLSGAPDGLDIEASRCTIQGLVIGGFAGDGILIGTGSHNQILGDYIGTDATGTNAQANGTGVEVGAAASHTTIGGIAAGQGNLISGNSNTGVAIEGSFTELLGNRIGTDITGTAVLANGNGVVIENGAQHNTIGDTKAAGRNLVSGNAGDGILMTGSDTTRNAIEGNYIGTTADGTAALANGAFGIRLLGGSHNTIGGSSSIDPTTGLLTGAGNLVAANGDSGIEMEGATDNALQGNYIGTDATGTQMLPNGLLNGSVPGYNFFFSDGIDLLDGCTNNLIGGVSSVDSHGNLVGLGNLVDNGYGVGIDLADVLTTGNDVTHNVIQGNFLGPDVTGARATAFQAVGIELDSGATDTTIGGTVAGTGNLISGNFYYNVVLGTGSSRTALQGNKIGTDVTGTQSLSGPSVNPFGAHGVAIGRSNDNLIGGTAPGAGNLISGNDGAGVSVFGASGTVIQGNKIGTDVTGTAALGNDRSSFHLLSADGIDLYRCTDTLVGGTSAAARNLISGGAAGGVVIQYSDNTTVQGNYIGTDITGTIGLGSQGFGVLVSGTGNRIGGTAAGSGNLISGNGVGVQIDDSNNAVQGNLIGTDASGTAVIGNAIDGVEFLNGSGSLLGGTTPAARNVIAGSQHGVFLYGFSHDDVVQGNYIGTDITGTVALGNGTGVLITQSTTGNVIGGSQPGAGNLISGNTDGVVITNTPFSSPTTGNVIAGNWIGTDSSGQAALGNTHDGVEVQDSGNLIGGTQPGAGNVIAFNGNDGVSVDGASGVAILHNAIFANGHLGIELLNNGNNSQPAPTLTAAQFAGGVTTIAGTFSGQPLTTYTLEFFANDSADPSGFGQGMRWLFSVQVTTDASGNADFTVSGLGTVSVGQFVTATATDLGNDTSEFSNDVSVTNS